MNWLYGGYFSGWYVLFGLGFFRWVLEDSERQSWWMIAFGLFAYLLLIPSLVLGMVGPIFEKIAARSEAEIQAAFERCTLTRGYAFGAGFVLSLMAMITSCVAWLAAWMEPDFFSVENLGENWLAVAMVSLMMGIVIVIALFPWLGVMHLLNRSRRRDPQAQQPAWPRAVSIIAVVVWATLIGWTGYRIVNATNTITMRLDFASLPATDLALQNWFDSQRGIVANVSRDGQTVVIEYRVSAVRTSGSSQIFDELVLEYSTLGGTRHTLHLTDAAVRLGYGRLVNSSVGTPEKRW